MITFGSVCSGIGCIDLGLERAGLRSVWQCEIDERRRGVLEKHWPDVHRYTDLKELAHDSNIPAVNVLVGGTPCPDFSVAGDGKGLDGERAALFYDFIRLADRLSPDWILWENVPNCKSTPKGDRGRDFALLLEGFTGYRPGIPKGGWKSAGACIGPLRWACWRVLDGQFFGPPQRRKRIIVFAGRAGTRPAPEILFNPDCVLGDPPPRREAGNEAPRDPKDRARDGGIPEVCGTVTRGVWNKGIHGSRAGHGFCLPVAGALTKSNLTNGQDNNAAQAGQLIPCVVDLQQATSPTHRSTPAPGRPCPTVTKGANLIAFHATQDPVSGDVVGTLSKKGPWGVMDPSSLDVRRLTPTEVERCFGLPDGWTAETSDGTRLSDRARGEMLGDGAIVDLFEWIGGRLRSAHEAHGRATA